MAKVQVGQAIIIFRGNYDASTTYFRYNAVYYNGSTYVLTVETATNVLPTDTTKWQIMAQGIAGTHVESFNTRTGAVTSAKGDYDITDIGAENGTEGQIPVVDGNGDLVLQTLDATSFKMSDGTTTIQKGITDRVENTVVAPVESGATASKAYSEGEQFIKGGKLCTAKTNIASGASLVVNTNYTEGSVADTLATKINKVSGATNGHLAGVNASGEVIDSGIVPSTLQPKTMSSPVSVGGVSKTTVEDSISAMNTLFSNNTNYKVLHYENTAAGVLTDNYTKYKFLLVTVQANNARTSILIDTGTITSSKEFNLTIFGVETPGSVTDFTYKASIWIKFNSNTSYTTTEAHNNPYFIAGVASILGIMKIA